MVDQQADYVCQVYITGSQAALLSAACQEALYRMDEQAGAVDYPAGLADSFIQLRDFFKDVTERPTAYPVNGSMARTLKVMKRRRKPRLSKKHRANLQRMEAERTTRTSREG